MPISEYKDLLLAMVGKEVKTRYKRTIFGSLWMLLNPVFQMVIVGTVFSVIIKFSINNYYLYLLSGLLLWNFFAQSVSKASESFLHERALIQKANIPRELIPFSIVIANSVHLLISILLIFFWSLLLTSFSFDKAFFLIISFVWIIILSLGISVFVASLNVLYRDISFFVQVGLQVLFYVTPVIYSLDMIPEKYIAFYSFNPLVAPISFIQYAISNNFIYIPNILIGNITITVLALIISSYVFKKLNRNFVDWL